VISLEQFGSLAHRQENHEHAAEHPDREQYRQQQHFSFHGSPFPANWKIRLAVTTDCFRQIGRNKILEPPL
jgi:hypothetical protein